MKLIVFDWDQTLWNSWGSHVKAIRYAASNINMSPPTEESISASFSVPFVEHMRFLFPECLERGISLYRDFYHECLKEEGHLFYGVVQLLELIKQRGFSTAIFSDKGCSHGEEELNYSGVSDLFDFTLFFASGRAYKPSPEGLQIVMEYLKVNQKDTLYIGDSYVDILSARNANVSSCAALWGSVSREALIAEQPDYIFESVNDLIVAFSDS